jgi:hypothetical protein
MPSATGAVAILPIIALWLVNACQEGAGMSVLNSELTRKHAATNLQHLMTLPPPVAGDGTDPASEKITESIHYLHNITHPDGAHDLVHYNVSSEVGLISLDFIPEVLLASREKEIGGSGGSLEPPGSLLTHLHAVYMVYSECLPSRLNPSSNPQDRLRGPVSPRCWLLSAPRRP